MVIPSGHARILRQTERLHHQARQGFYIEHQMYMITLPRHAFTCLQMMMRQIASGLSGPHHIFETVDTFVQLSFVNGFAPVTCADVASHNTLVICSCSVMPSENLPRIDTLIHL
jgi:ATP adenylyltransferase/5',5'''-P-1,P-4-tetraphosphate phosphorylase II